MQKIILILMLVLLSILSMAQVTISTIIEPEITVCGNSEKVTIIVVNNKLVTASNPNIEFALPAGIDYVSGSLNVLFGSVSEGNIANLSAPQFSSSAILAGDSLSFEIQIDANTNAISAQQSGTVFRNDITYTDQVDQQNHLSAPYNILYPAISITSVSPSSITALSGQQVQRTITIVNAGYGSCNSIVVTDLMNNLGLSIGATSSGTLSSNGQDITLSSSDFSTIGNNDGLFDFGETFVLTETIDLSGCSNITVSSAITASWGCNGAAISTSNSNAHITISQQTPQLSVVSSYTPSTCFGEPSSASLSLENNGQGVATNVDIEIYKSIGAGYNEDIFSRLDEASCFYQINGGALVAFTPQITSTRNDGNYSCLGNNPVGKINYALPFNMSPGDKVEIFWDIYQCCISECLDQGNMGWAYTVDYQDFCLNNSYSKNDKGEEATELNATIFTESPTDIDDGQQEDFNYHISSWENNLPAGQGAHYTVKFSIPSGLQWSGVSTDINWKMNNQVWSPFSVTYNASTSELFANFAVNAPFNIPKSEIEISLTGFCDNGTNSGLQNLILDISYVPDTLCTSICEVAMICTSQIQTYLHCPVGNCEGVYFYDYSMLRKSFGSSDNDLNGLADANNNLNMGLIEAGRSMMGDTLQAVYSGVVMSSTGQTFNNLFAESTIEMGTLLLPYKATIQVYDSNQNLTFSCDKVVISYYDSGTDRILKFRAISSSLFNDGCADFGNYQFQAGDSLKLLVDFKMDGNLGPQVQEIKITNKLFLSQQNDPWANGGNQYYCDFRDGRHTLIGYDFVNESKSSYNFTKCTKTIQQSFRLSIGDCCNNYEGGNLFPYEYRNWAHLKELQVVIPPYYTVVDAYFKQKRTKATNSSVAQTVLNLLPTSNSPVTLTYSLESLYEGHGGVLQKSDDGFSGTFYLELAPSCDVAVNTYEDVVWSCKFEKSAMLGGGSTSWIYPVDNDRIKYNPVSLNLTSSNPIQDGENRTVTWPIKVANGASNFDADNAWLHFKSPNNSIEFVSLLDGQGDTISIDGDIFPLGEIDHNSNETYFLTCTYTACAPDYLVAYAGYECSAYPDSFAYFYCPYVTLPLHVEPKMAEMQARITGNAIGGLCSNTLEIEVEMASVKFGHLDSMRISFEAMGSSISYIPGTTELSFPASASYVAVSDPTGSTLKEYKVEDLNTYFLDNGLPGVGDLTKSRLKLKFQLEIENNYNTGDYVNVNLSSSTMCKLQLPSVSLAYDPAIELTPNTNTGLTNMANDTWGVSWVDYDNDGYDDCFVSNYDQNEGNKLYHNNSDGTFSQVTTGTITTQLTNTVSSSWADYDNDGDNDAFLAQNVGGPNMLYRNDGNGVFTLDVTLSMNNYSGYCHNATWVDYDNDGLLDVFVTDYMPTKYNLLYHNDGNGQFSSVNNTSIVMDAMKSIGSTWADYDGDGDVDAFVPNTNGENNCLYRNDGNGAFTKIVNGDIVSDGGNSVGCSWGDYNNDGDVDLFVANTGKESDFLYTNNGDGTFTKNNSTVVTTSNYNSSGSSWVDVDNDGDLDLYVTRDLGDPSTLYVNNGNGGFTASTDMSSGVQGNSYPNAWSDYDNDGDLDAFIGNRGNENDIVFENKRGNCNEYICFTLIGTESNKSAIGAKVRVLADINGSPSWQLREISAQTGGGAGSQNSMKAYFGLNNTTTVDSVIIEWPSGQNQILLNLPSGGCNEIIEPTGSMLCGSVFEDLNGNCVQDTGESILPNQLIKIMPGSRYTVTDENGLYTTYLEDGTFSVNVVSNPVWSPSCNNITLITINGSDTCGVDFGMISLCTTPDLEVNTGATALRRGFKNNLVINCKNNSSITATGVVLELELDEEIIPLSADLQWDAVMVNDSTVTYIWNFTELLAFQDINITVVDSIDLYAPLDDFLTISASISSNEGDCDPSNNISIESDVVVGSVDPNDKLVFPNKKNGIADITKEDRLRYKIRFQNVGNYYASRVIITDTLSQFLDLETIQFEGMTHDFTYTIEKNIIQWTVNNIVLPDSSENMEGSQGFVEFTIKPLESVDHESLIINSAAIQFDYNDELITNNVYSRFVAYDATVGQEIITKIFPNPAESVVNVSMLVSDSDIYLPISVVHILTSKGQVIKSEKCDDKTTVLIDIDDLNPGLYIIRTTDVLGRSVAGKLIVVH